MFTHPRMSDGRTQLSGWRRFGWFHLPVVLYSAVIIVVSSIPDLRTPELRVVAFDKLAHFLEYAVFAAIIYRSFSNSRTLIRPNRAFLYGVTFVSLFATFDELYQRLIPGRFSSAADVAADIAGAILVLAYLEVRRRRLSATPQG